MQRRSAPLVGVPVLVVLAVVTAVAAASAGYFASSWGWSSLALLWIFALSAGRVGCWDLRARVYAAALFAFAGWTWLSMMWAPMSTVSVREGERTLVMLAGVAAVLATVGRRSATWLVAGLLCSTGAISTYALATRLFPQSLATDAVSQYRLTRPIGYWNSLGIYAAIGFAVAIGLAARGNRWTRALAAAATPIFAATIYFTYSRGAVIALAIGLVVTFALDRERTQWLLALVPLGALAGVGVLVGSRSPALTTEGASLHRAASEGHRLALLIVVLSLVGAALAAWRSAPLVSARTDQVVTAVVALALVVAVIGGIVEVGGPGAIKNKFTAAPPVTHGQLNKRLFSFSGSHRVPLWHVAWQEYKAHPLVGGGAGSYETYYLQHRTRPDKVKNAHNLYLETLAELGPIGLALLLLALLTPLYAAVKARRHPLVPALAGAYVAFLVHMAVDWDWQVTAVALTGLFCGAAILVAARPEELDEREASPRVRYLLLGATLVVMVVAFVGLVGNMSLAQASTAADKGNWTASAHDAKRAHTWAPWSSEPYRLLGEAQLGEGDTKAATASFDKAIAKSRDDWNLWFDLARATQGHAQRDALREARHLNPLSPEVAELAREIAAQKVIQVVPK